MNKIYRSIRINFLNKISALQVFDVTVQFDARRFCTVRLRGNGGAGEVENCGEYVVIKFHNILFYCRLLFWSGRWSTITYDFSIF